MVEILEEDARLHPKEPPIVLWDFSGTNSITTECILPHNKQASQMQWYYDGSHYSTKTGDLILDRIFDYKDATRHVPDNFGVQLSSDMLNKYFASMEKDLQQYANMRPETVEEEIELSLNGNCR
jgi:hypothetical protein